jgi:hypothetical protein
MWRAPRVRRFGKGMPLGEPTGIRLAVGETLRASLYVFGARIFRSELSRSDFQERLAQSLAKGPGVWGALPGDIYGVVSDDRFELWTPGSTRGHVAGVVGRLDPGIDSVSGSVRLLPEPLALVSPVLIVLLAIASQFLAMSWVRVGLPVVAFLAVALIAWQARVEWQLLVRHLRETVQVELDSLPDGRGDRSRTRGTR